jgi:hypothetical protein
VNAPCKHPQVAFTRLKALFKGLFGAFQRVNAPDERLQGGFKPVKPAVRCCAAAFRRLLGAFQRANAPDKRLQGGFKPMKPAVRCCAAAFRRLFGAFQRVNAPDKRLSAGNGCLKTPFQGGIYE